MSTYSLRRLQKLAPALLTLSLIVAPRTFGQMNNRLPANLAPEIHAWFAGGNDFFAPEGYRRALDLFADHSNFGLLTSSIRSPQNEMILTGTHDQVKRAVEYAHQRGLRVSLDLDIRLARRAFQARYPDQQQWMLRLRPFALPLPPAGVQIESSALRDHMGQYPILSGRVMRLWAVGQAGARQLESGCTNQVSAQKVSVTCSPDALKGATSLVVAAAFEYQTPDVFAPDFLPFQNQMLAQYGDIPLDGTMKDEWGFPPIINQGAKDGDFWYSKPFADAYAKAGGGDFLNDCLLMCCEWSRYKRSSALVITRYSERQAAGAQYRGTNDDARQLLSPATALSKSI
jgi:hypothetical protein